MTWLALTLALLAAPKPPLTIYVFTKLDPSGFVDGDQQQRVYSVRYLNKVLGKSLNDFKPVIVGAPEQAQVVVEVLSSKLEDLGDRTGWNPLTGFIGANRVVREKIIRARVSVAKYSTDIVSLQRSPVGRTPRPSGKRSSGSGPTPTRRHSRRRWRRHADQFFDSAFTEVPT